MSRYLIVGLWLIAGVRFGIWNQGLLLCIPIFLFLFAIYYSVSALAGVVWRNAIICIVHERSCSGFVCTVVVEQPRVALNSSTIEQQRIVRLVQAGDTLIALDEQGLTKYWNAASNDWEETFLDSSFGPRGQVMGPVYDAENQTLMAAQRWRPRPVWVRGDVVVGKGK